MYCRAQGLRRLKRVGDLLEGSGKIRFGTLENPKFAGNITLIICHDAPPE
jgi:hypothetical protein